MLDDIATFCPNLIALRAEEIYLGHSYTSEAVWQRFWARLKHLKELQMLGCDSLLDFDKCIAPLLVHGALDTIDVQYCRITDASLQLLATNAIELKNALFTNCPKITSKGARILIDAVCQLPALPQNGYWMSRTIRLDRTQYTRAEFVKQFKHIFQIWVPENATDDEQEREQLEGDFWFGTTRVVVPPPEKHALILHLQL